MNAANSAMKLRRKAAVASLVTSPSSLMRPRSNCTYASIEFISGELQNARMLRRCCCPIAVPILRGEAPITADGVRANAFVP